MAVAREEEDWLFAVEGVHADYSRGLYDLPKGRELLWSSALLLPSRCIRPNRFAGRPVRLRIVWTPEMDECRSGATHLKSVGWARVRKPHFDVSLWIPTWDAGPLMALATGGHLGFVSAASPPLSRGQADIIRFSLHEPGYDPNEG